MNDPLSDVESRVRDLEQSLRGMELRIARIEDHLVLAPAAVEPHVLARPPNTYDFVAVLSNIGRTFVALGGAYLLRALTDSGILPQRAGIAVGLAYAVAWLIAADRAGAAGRVVSSAFHGFVAALIAFPLLWEAVTRFKLVDPEWSAVLLGLVTALGLTVAVRQRLQVLAWITILAALPTTIALISATEALLPFALFAIVLGVATLWLGYSLEWVWLRWPAALVANVTVIALIARVSSRSWPDRPTYVIAVQLFLLTGYLLSIVVRTLVRGRDVNTFEVVQALAVLAAGFGGAVYVAQATGFGASALAMINLAIAAGCYGVAFAFVAKRDTFHRNFYFYTWLALVLALVSTGLLLSGATLALVWAAAGPLASWLARRSRQRTLTVHAAAYVIAAAATSGLLASAADALTAPARITWHPWSPTSFAVLAALVACWLIPMPAARADRETHDAVGRIPRLAIAVALAWSTSGWLVAAATSLLDRLSDRPLDAGAIATVRTSVLAAAALAVARAGRYDRFAETRWLLYPLLVMTGVKLFIEDLPRSRPATLFVALALYGGALIAAPRIVRAQPRAYERDALTQPTR